MSISKWMSWEAGVDLAAMTTAGMSMPNIIVHVARMVHTPVGSAPAGMILYAPNADAPNAAAPSVMGFVSTNRKVAEYFGPNIFAGTPFEKAPTLDASIDVDIAAAYATASVRVAGHVFEVRLSKFRPIETINRPSMAMTPFTQQGLEAAADEATLTVNGIAATFVLPPVGLGGGAAAVYSPAGVYAR